MIKKYPDHFYEPIRVEIAASQMAHDLRKLLPDLDVDEWEKIDKHIRGWFQGELYELEPVRDFWNFFGGFARGLKLKSLLFWITAENIEWVREDVPVDDIVITWDFPGTEFMGKAPYKASELRKKLFKPEKQEILEWLKQDSDFRSGRYAPRDHFPVVLFHDDKGGVLCRYKGYYILEGNRRTIRAIITNGQKIQAYVGHFKSKEEVWPRGYWLRTGILNDLIFLSIWYDKEKDDRAFRIVREFYQLLLRDFDVDRIETYNFAFKVPEVDHKLMDEILKKDME